MPSTNNKIPNFILKLTISIFLVGFLLFSSLAIYLSNISFWWNKVGNSTQKNFGGELVCRKKSWSSFGVLQLESCLTQNDSFSFSFLEYKPLSGYISVDDLSIIQMKGSKKKSLSMPHIPYLIQELEINNLNMNKLKGNVLLSHINTINSIILKRKSFLSNNWDIKSNINEENLLLKGTLGDRLDLTAVFKEFAFEIDSIKTQLNGKMFLGTSSLGKKPFEIVFNDFSLLNTHIQNRSLGEVKITGLAFLTKQLKNIQGFSNFKLQSKYLNLISDDRSKNRLLIENTDIKNLKGLVNHFSKSFKIKRVNNGLLSGYIDFEEKDIKKSDLFLRVESLRGLFLKTSQRTYEVPDLNASILFKPLANKEKVQDLFKSNNIQKLELVISPYKLSKLNSFIKNIDITEGNVDGQFIYNSNNNDDRKGLFKISNLKMVNEKNDISVKNGNGRITINNQDIDILLKAYNGRANTNEEITVKGKLVWKTLLNGSIDIFAPEFTYAKNQTPKAFRKLETTIKDLNAKAIIQNNKIIGYKANGKFSQCLCELIDDKNQVQINGGSFAMNYPGSISINKLSISSGDSDSVISANLLLDKSFRITPYRIDMRGKSNIDDLENLLGIFNNKLQNNQLDFAGHMDYQIVYAEPNFKKFDVSLKDFAADYQNKNFINNLNGKLEIRGKDLVLNNIYSRFGDDSQFKLFARLNNFTQLIKPNRKVDIEKLIEKSEVRIRALVNPNNFVQTLKAKGVLDESFKTEFDRSIYLPVFIKAYPKMELVGFDFATNFQKLQINQEKVHLSQDLSKLEHIYGSGDFSFKDKKLRINEVNYRGKNFGILANMQAQQDFVSFNLESAPLIDLSELSKIWFNENASGQFKGKIISTGFNPQVETSWLNNLEVSFRSEENVHDIQYGILYGKHFDFELKTVDGDGKATLKTQKGKLKNLQVTDLVSEANIIDGSVLEMTNTSFKAADGEVSLKGKIDLRNWDSKFTGKMEDVNIETMSNNLFGNAGDYNGKGTLTYDFGGNFLDLVTSKPPKKATGEFTIESGFLNQTAELSKNLHLANLVFGGPLNFRLNTLNNFLNPTGEGDFKYINGKWRFDNEGKNVIHFEEANYTGENALHLKIIGDWDYKEKYLDFDVYGFIPKKPMTLSDRQANIERFKKKEKERLLRDLLSRSRHFKFQVKGSPAKPNQITNSVKNSIQFVDSSPRNEVSKNFLNQSKKKNEKTNK